MFVSMQLATYIKDLLYRYECVIIPGFGAFLTQKESARIDNSHVFYPPGKTILFHRQLQTNDGILANYLASVENCSYELALQKIRNFTGRLSLELAEGKTITLQNIGSFFLNDEQIIQFIPSEKENFNTASFGLASFSSPLVERADISEEEKQPIPLYSEKKKTTYPFLRYASIAAIALVIGGAGGLQIYEGQVEQHNFAEKQKADSLVNSQIQEATFVIDNPLPALTLSVTKNEGRYHIVAGAFREEQNAQKKIDQLNAEGYKAQMVGINKYGLHQVVYSSHTSRSEARSTLRAIKHTVNKDAWILVLDLNR